MGNGSGIGAVMADTAGGSTEGTGSSGITDFSGAARASDWAWAIGMAALGKDGAVGTDWGGIGGGSKCGAQVGNGPVSTGSIRVGAAVTGMGREQTGSFGRAQGMGGRCSARNLGGAWNGGGLGQMTGAAGSICWAEGCGSGGIGGGSGCGMDTGSDSAASGRVQGTSCGAEAEVAGVISKVGMSAAESDGPGAAAIGMGGAGARGLLGASAGSIGVSAGRGQIMGVTGGIDKA